LTSGVKSARAAGGRPVLGYLPEVRQDRLGLLLRLFRTYGPVVRFRMGPVWIHVVADPAVAEAILVAGATSYRKGIGQDFARSFLGNGLLTSEGAEWQGQRRIIRPLFSPLVREAQLDSVRGAVTSMVAGWKRDRRRVLPILGEMMNLTLGISWKLMFGELIGTRREAARRVLDLAFDDVGRRIVSPFALPLWFPAPANLRVRRSLGRFESLIEEAISETPARPQAMLTELREQYRGKALRDQVTTLLFSGHETTAVALAWVLQAAASPHLWDRLRGQGSEGRPSELLRSVVRESLRLHPPVWGIPRTAQNDHVAAGLLIPAGSIVLVSPFLMHRDPAAWDAPEQFQPQRFIAGVPACARRHYLPFGLGPRHCVGRGLAEASLEEIVAGIVGSCRLRLRTPGGDPEALLTLRPPPGLEMELHA
jgi:cytochrome P450